MGRLDELSNLAAAREIYANFPGAFSSVERARGALRHRIGASGKASREHLNEEPRLSTIQEGLAKIKRHPEDRGRVVSLKGKVGLLGDIHLGEHDIVPLTAAIQTLKDVNVESIIFNGDLVDMYSVSGFTKEVGRFTLQEEIDITRDFLGHMRKLFPNAVMEWNEGNHEQRLRRYILTHAKEFAHLDALSMENLFGLDDFKVGYVKTEKIMLGKLAVLHGHERKNGIAPSVNPARGLWLWAKANALVGHHHKTSYHPESSLAGEHFGCWSVGCLCTLTPEYNPFGYVSQNHGFAWVDVKDNGNFRVHNHTIKDGEVF
jgi:hypothetical protein